jgi:hypothetical protein
MNVIDIGIRASQPLQDDSNIWLIADDQHNRPNGSSADWF